MPEDDLHRVLESENTESGVKEMAVIPMNRKAVSVPEAAEMIGLSVTRMYQLVHCGQVPAKHVGKRWLVPLAALDRWLETPDVEPVQMTEEEKFIRWG